MQEMYPQKVKAIPHNSRLTTQAPLRRLRHGICVAKMLDNVGLRYPHRASGTKAPRTLRPLPLLRFAVSATGGAHLCSIQYYLRFWLSSCRTSLAVSALRIMRYCLYHEKDDLESILCAMLATLTACITITGWEFRFGSESFEVGQRSGWSKSLTMSMQTVKKLL